MTPPMLPCEECKNLTRATPVDYLVAHQMTHHGQTREEAEMTAVRLKGLPQS
jgi:hypothetical protein